MGKTFEGKVALVTGGASGIGLATVEMFADAGAAVAIVDLDEAAARRAAERLRSSGHRVLAIGCDVSDDAQVAAMVARTVAELGRLDAAFNNAGIQSPPVDTADSSGSEFDRTVGVNLRGVWSCMKHELAHMRAQGSGAIVNCSSLGGLVGLPNRGIYHATKHGVLGLTKSAALEYAARGIRVNAVCPGTIETPMVTEMLKTQADALTEILRDQPIGRLGRADEIASAVLWLCGPESTFVIGHALAVDGGYTVH